MITMKLAMLAGGAFVFACVCGAGAVVDFDTAAPPAFGTSGCDGWDFGECNSPEPIDGQEQARNCEKWDIFGSDKKLCTPWNTEPKPVDGDEVAGDGWRWCGFGDICSDQKEPAPEPYDQVAVHCFFTEEGCNWKRPGGFLPF